MHNDYPLAPEKLEASNDMLSKYCSDITKKYGIKVDDVNKLVQNLGNKSKYILHYRNFQLYMSLGIKLVSVHRILKFNPSDWKKQTLILILSKEKMLLIVLKFFFFNNSVYGKTMENLRKRIKVRLVNNSKDYKK